MAIEMAESKETAMSCRSNMVSLRVCLLCFVIYIFPGSARGLGQLR